MKKLILLLALAFVMFGCAQTPARIYDKSINVFYVTEPTFVIDSCEYIENNGVYTHKGNCKFCAERRKKEQEELIRRLKEELTMSKIEEHCITDEDFEKIME